MNELIERLKSKTYELRHLVSVHCRPDRVREVEAVIDELLALIEELNDED